MGSWTTQALPTHRKIEAARRTRAAILKTLKANPNPHLREIGTHRGHARPPFHIVQGVGGRDIQTRVPPPSERLDLAALPLMNLGVTIGKREACGPIVIRRGEINDVPAFGVWKNDLNGASRVVDAFRVLIHQHPGLSRNDDVINAPVGPIGREGSQPPKSKTWLIDWLRTRGSFFPPSMRVVLSEGHFHTSRLFPMYFMRGLLSMVFVGLSLALPATSKARFAASGPPSNDLTSSPSLSSA